MSDPEYDASRVMLNGAAIGLVTSLTTGMEARLITEIKAAEERQNSKLESAVLALSGDVDELEAWRESEMSARIRRDGQWSVFRNSARFADRYGKILLALALALASILVASLGGVHVSIGS
jgi:hypothetical protein